MSGGGSWTTSAVSDDLVVVYRTRVLHEADMVAEAMSRAQMPCVRRVETLGGLSTAMPLNPPPGLLPGNLWAIAVPRSWAERAVHFIAELPVSQEPEPSGEFRAPGVKEFFHGWTWLFVFGIVLALLWTVIRMWSST